jgi:hypothetical protein
LWKRTNNQSNRINQYLKNQPIMKNGDQQKPEHPRNKWNQTVLVGYTCIIIIPEICTIEDIQVIVNSGKKPYLLTLDKISH